MRVSRVSGLYQSLGPETGTTEDVRSRSPYRCLTPCLTLTPFLPSESSHPKSCASVLMFRHARPRSWDEAIRGPVAMANPPADADKSRTATLRKKGSNDMFFSKSISAYTPSQSRHFPRGNRSQRARPRVEPLETRTLLHAAPSLMPSAALFELPRPRGHRKHADTEPSHCRRGKSGESTRPSASCPAPLTRPAAHRLITATQPVTWSAAHRLITATPP